MRPIIYFSSTMAFIALILFLTADRADPTQAVEFSERYGKPVLFYTEWCSYCAQTQQFLQQNAIAYDAFDVEKSAAAKMQYEQINKQLNGWGVPLLVINGKAIRGFLPEQILTAL